MKVNTSVNYKPGKWDRIVEGEHETVPDDTMTIREIVEKYVVVTDRSDFVLDSDDVDTNFEVDPGTVLGTDFFEAHEVLVAAKERMDEAQRKKDDIGAKIKLEQKKKLEEEKEELQRLRNKDLEEQKKETKKNL